jgi:hypothetical protein
MIKLKKIYYQSHLYIYLLLITTFIFELLKIMTQILFSCPDTMCTYKKNIIERFRSDRFYKAVLCNHCGKNFADCEEGFEFKTPSVSFGREMIEMDSYSDRYIDEQFETERVVIVWPYDPTDQTNPTDQIITDPTNPITTDPITTNSSWNLFKEFNNQLDAGLLEFMQKDGEVLFKTEPKKRHLITRFGPDYGEEYDNEPFVTGSIKPVIEDSFIARIPFSKNTSIRYFNSDGSERDTVIPKGTKCHLHLKYCGPEYIKRNSFWNEWLLLGVYAVK